MTRKYLKNIRIDYLFVGTKSISLTSGFWLIYLASKGVSLAYIGILEGIFHITSLLMETPTGAVADVLGRKYSRLLGLIMNIIHIIIFINGTQVWHFAVAFIFCALAYNLESGAGEALVYDSLKEARMEDRFSKISGIKEVIFQTASGFGVIIGGFLATIHYDLPFQVAIGIMIMAFLIGLFFKEVPVLLEHEKTSLGKSIINQYVVSYQFIKSAPRLLYLTLTLNGAGTFVLIAFFYAQNYWKGMGITEGVIGILLALHGGFAALGGFFAHKIEKILGERKIIIFTYASLTLLYSLLFFKWTSFVAIILLGFIDSLLYVVMSAYMNHLIPSQQRATLLSFSSMVFSILMILCFPAVGFLGDFIGLDKSFLILTLILALITAGLLKKIGIGQKEV